MQYTIEFKVQVVHKIRQIEYGISGERAPSFLYHVIEFLNTYCYYRKFSSASSSDSTSEDIREVATGINININRASTLPAER